MTTQNKCVQEWTVEDVTSLRALAHYVLLHTQKTKAKRNTLGLV